MPPKQSTKTSKELKKRLKAMQERWEQRKDTPPGAPDGNYLAQLQAASLHTSQNGKLSIQRKWIILQGEYKGEQLTDYLGLESDWGLYFTAQFMSDLGYDLPDDIEDIDETLAEIVADKLPILIEKETRDEFVNIRVIGVDEDTPNDDDDDDEEEEAEPDDEAEEAEPDDGDDEGEEVDVQVGAVIEWEYKGEPRYGHITEIKGGKIRALDHTAKRVTVVDPDTILSVGEAGDAPFDSNEEDEETPETETEPDNGDETETETLEQLLAVATSYGIEYEEDEVETVEDAVAILEDYEFKAEELLPEEKEILEQHIPNNIVAAKPKPKSKTKPKPKTTTPKAKGKTKAKK